MGWTFVFLQMQFSFIQQIAPWSEMGSYSEFFQDLFGDGGKTLEQGIDIMMARTYEECSLLVVLLQALELMEIVHAALGWVPGRVGPSMMLQMGRDVVLAAIILCPTTHMDWGTPLLYLTWSFGEIIRFPYYLCSVQQIKSPYFLEYARYSAFLLLMPVGFAAELRCYYAASLSPLIADFEMFEIEGPQLVLVFCLAVYGLGAPILFSSMLRQRRKKLGPAKDSKKKKQ